MQACQALGRAARLRTRMRTATTNAMAVRELARVRVALMTSRDCCVHRGRTRCDRVRGKCSPSHGRTGIMNINPVCAPATNVAPLSRCPTTRVAGGKRLAQDDARRTSDPQARFQPSARVCFRISDRTSHDHTSVMRSGRAQIVPGDAAPSSSGIIAAFCINICRLSDRTVVSTRHSLPEEDAACAAAAGLVYENVV